MFKEVARKLALGAALSVLSAIAAHADTSSNPPPPTADSVTGTDPTPPSPKTIEIILALLYLA
jgi:hypothetical protein